jgi:hypothetical protein
MNITEEWRIFDPTDPRTHPEGVARVEFEFEDGCILPGQYSRDTGFSGVGTSPVNTTMKPTVKRWRYTSNTPDAA